MRKYLPLLLAALALCALAGDVVLYRAAKKFYAREALVRLELSEGPSFTESGPDQGPRVLLLGDSRIVQWADFAVARVHAFNAGVNGETTGQIRARAREAIEYAKPSVIVIEAGINDLKAIPVLPDWQHRIEHDCENHLMEIVQLGRAHGAAVVLCSVLPAGRVEWSRRPVWSPAVAEAVDAVNRRLAERCSGREKVVFVDLTREVQPRDYADTLHFHPAFYQRISPRLMDAIHAVLREIPPTPKAIDCARPGFP